MCHVTKKSINGPKLKIPLPDDPKIRSAIIEKYFETQEWEKDYQNSSAEIKAISDYTGISFGDVLELPVSLFLLYRKESWIYFNSKSENGKEFLKALWRLRQTNPDYEAIHKFQGGV